MLSRLISASKFSAEDLLRDFESPLFVIDEENIEKNYFQFYQAFNNLYPNIAVGYSVKTNYLPWICKKLFELGAIPEVVSGLELDLVEKLGYFNENIIVNGPMKSDEEISRVIEKGGNLNIDNSDELDRVHEIASRKNKIIDVAIRINVETDKNNWNRFGFSIENGDAYCIAERIGQLQTLRLVGVHTHLGTNITDLYRYRDAARAVSKLLMELISGGLVQLEYINMGGGYASGARLYHFEKDNWVVPEYNQYAEVIISELRLILEKYQPILYVEPGRVLINESVNLLATVIAVKPSGLVIDAGKNIIPSASFIDHSIENISSANQESKLHYQVYGPLCMNSDLIHANCVLAPTQVGDVISISGVGAYNFSQSMRFIRYQPAYISINSQGVSLVRRKEKIENIVDLDCMFDD